MIEPTPNDIGRKVIYTSGHGEQEEGVITSLNNYFVFVRYGANVQSMATHREDLQWTAP